jgi:hypothetical protein
MPGKENELFRKFGATEEDHNLKRKSDCCKNSKRVSRRWHKVFDQHGEVKWNMLAGAEASQVNHMTKT